MTATRRFSEKYLQRPLGVPKMKLCTKFEVSSSNSFEDILDRFPENLGVT